VDDESLQSGRPCPGTVDGPRLTQRLSTIGEGGGGSRSVRIVVGWIAWGW